MKRGFGIALLIAALAGSFALGRVNAQDEEEGGDAAMAEMAAWMELAKPGPEHEALKSMAGKWVCETKHQPDPDAEPMVEKGTSNQTMILNGLFLQQEFEGTMMGGPFKGVGYTGFNKATGKFESIWMDSMGSGIMFMTGTEKEKGKSWTYEGHMFGPKAVKIPMKSVMTKVSDDEFTFAMSMSMDGQDHEMSMTYKRAKE